jgi:hypothetical protein
MWTMNRFVRWGSAALIVAATLAGCGGSSSSGGSAPARPSCNAVLTIVSPTANQVVGPTPTVVFNLVGGQVVPITTGTPTCARGHIHVSVDNLLVSMAFGLTQTLAALTPGPHLLQGEYVAVDHKPFANRVIAKQLFTVKAP